MPNREEIHNCAEKLLSSTVLAGNVAATLTTALTGANNDLVFTAKVGGAGGNAITVAYVDPSGNNQALAVTVAELAISVSLATGAGGAITSTASQILAAINADATAKMLVTASLAAGNDGSGVVIAMAATNLAGGDSTVITSAALDTFGFDSGHFNLHFGAVAPAPTTIAVTESDDDSTYTAAPATSVISDYDTTASLVNKTVRIAYVGNKRYAKIAVTPSAATDLTISGHTGYAFAKPVQNPL